MAKTSYIRWLLYAVLALAVLFAVLALLVTSYLPAASRGVVQVAAIGLLVAVVLLLLLWLLWKGAHIFLWRVGRRLAFSYFLIGVLPIPMVLLLLALNAYLLAGYFLGHLYRDSVRSLHSEVTHAAHVGLDLLEGRPNQSFDADTPFALARYRDGHRLSGDERFPEQWPAWLSPSAEDSQADGSEGDDVVSFVTLADESPTLAATATRNRQAVLAVYDGDLEQALRQRSHVWITLLRVDDPRKESLTRLRLAGKEYALMPLVPERGTEGRAEFFGTPAEGSSKLERPFIWWGEIAGSLRNLADGGVVSEYMVASLNGSLPIIYRHLLSASAELNTSAWISLIATTGLLSTIYVVAIVMAFYMIFSLSLAVNRLSRATNALQKGDFSVRIPVRRRDQVGELQHSFNEMAANLEQSLHAVTQKEILENELQIARNLQQSLLPSDLPSSETVDFATLFEPSAAIGGDYFDILRIPDDRLVVVIADVSGHGLPTGLRMAMLKAALVILVEEQKDPVEILRRLSAMVRAEGEKRFFVTSTLSVVDFRRGTLEITNAGHPPTYLLRNGSVEEILLQGNPLGALGEEYGSRTVDLTAGDVAVWLSDGLIEATNGKGEPFGYDRIHSSLAGAQGSALDIRDRLLEALESHTEGHPIEDDRTLVAMRYLASAEPFESRNE